MYIEYERIFLILKTEKKPSEFGCGKQMKYFINFHRKFTLHFDYLGVKPETRMNMCKCSSTSGNEINLVKCRQITPEVLKQIGRKEVY